jgi:DNA polymerase-3 subunit delta'
METIQINNSIIERFDRLNKKNRLAHAYFFIGPPDIGKYETALAVAKMLNCDSYAEGRSSAACGTCPSCMKVEAGSHPDVITLRSEPGQSIKIEQIRDYLLERIRLRSFYGRKKVSIIENAENMTAESANAFLKTLEEPDMDTLLILTTAVPERCLDTIRSRCHSITFQPMAADILKTKLREDCTDKEAHFLAFFAEGCCGKAMKLEESKYFNRKNDYIDLFILNQPPDDFIKRVTEDKNITREFLAALYSWVRDALLLKAGMHPDQVVNIDRVAQLREFNDRYGFDDLRQIEIAVVKAMRMLSENLNIKVPLMIVRTLLR